MESSSVIPSDVVTAIVTGQPQGEDIQWGLPVPAFEAAVVVLGIIGILGNTMVLVVFKRGLEKFKHQRMASMFIVNQAAIDCCAGFWLVVSYLYKLLKPATVYLRGSAGFASCIILDGELPLWCSLNTSVYGLLLITFERYMKIVHPITHRTSFGQTMTIIIMVVSWLWPFTFMTVFTVPFTSVKDGQCLIQGSWPSKALQETYGTLKLFLFFIIPVFLMIIGYSHMLCMLKKRIKPQTDIGPLTTTNKMFPQAQMNLTKVMVVITATFLICWVPSNIYYLLFNLGKNNLGFTHPIYYIFLFMVFLNSCLNPMIYTWKLTGFKAALMSFRQTVTRTSATTNLETM